MHDPLTPQHLEPLGELSGEVPGDGLGQPVARPAVRLPVGLEVPPVAVLQYEEQLLPRLDGVDEPEDVGVGEAAEDGHLLQDAAADVVVDAASVDLLDGDARAGGAVRGAEDLGEGALPHHLLQLVLPHDPRRRRRRRVLLRLHRAGGGGQA